jgi:penicillin-binding protein 2
MGEISPEELRCEPYSDCKGGDFIGKFGIEKAYETLLRGKRGGRQVEVNATGQIVRVLESVHAQPGENVYLTIDQQLQKATEDLLRNKAAAAVAIDPGNGEVLAMASSPSFDPNLFVTGMTRDQWHAIISNPYRTLENKAIQAEYPPASTYKLITAIAGLEEGVIDENSTHFCPGFYKYGNRVFRCWKRGGHGKVDVIQALKVSCDVFFYQVGEALGVDRLAWYAKAAGLGDITGVHLDRESRGLIPTADWKRKRFGVPWMGGETLSVAIGQGYNLTTPLQMANLTGAVGKGGVRYKPQLVKKRVTAENQVTFEYQPQIAGRIPIKTSTLALVKSGLWQVVNESRGTAYRSRLKGVDLSGKTGTAQVVGRKSESYNEIPDDMFKDHAWFVAYAPSDDPQIAVAVIVEHGEHGSSAAAPVAREIIRTYLGLPEDEMSAVIRSALLESGEAGSAATHMAEGD